MQLFLFTFFVSFFSTCLIVLTKSCHLVFSGDISDKSPQKFHRDNTPRVGGLSIILSLLVVNLYEIINNYINHLLIFAAFIFLLGFAEDISKKINSFFRLFFILLGSFLFCYLSGIRIERIGFELFDAYLKNHLLISCIFTSIAIASITNAFNIIDGYNGLSSMSCILMLLSLLLVSIECNDNILIFYSLIGIGSIFGFFIWNWPFGKIFLGDGGAYLIGFYLSINLILLISRNEQISSWYPITLLSYPIIELLFSIFRKSVIRKKSALLPDALHFHMLIFKRVFKYRYKNNLLKSNSSTSIFFWIFVLFSQIPATIFCHDSFWLIISFILNLFLYFFVYKSLINFRFNFFKLI